MKTIIIGARSQLSKYIEKELDESILISITKLEEITSYINYPLTIIFNNFQPATKLNDFSEPVEYIDRSVRSTAIVLDIIKKYKLDVKKIIYTSSSSVYGNNNFCNETDNVNPLSLQASLKVSNEEMIKKFCKENQINYTITRLFNMYGHKDDSFSIISKILYAMKNEKKLSIVNNGSSIRDYIHIEDVVKVYLYLVKNYDVSIPIINIGTGIGTTLKSILDLLDKNNLELEITNIMKDELKISISNNNQISQNKILENFISVEEYVNSEIKKFIEES